MPHTDKPTLVTQAIVDLLTTNKVSLGLKAIHYGDTRLVPAYPVALVESGPKAKPLDGSATRRFRVTLSTIITVLHGKVQDVDTTKKATEEFAEAIEAKIEEDFTLGGLVIFGHVSAIDPGIAAREGVMVRASRLTWEAISRKDF